MEITAKFNNGEEMLAFARLLLGQDHEVKFVPSHEVSANVEPSKEDDTEKQEGNLKKDLIKTMVEAGDKALEDKKDPEPVEDKREEAPKVTKEMVRAVFSKLIKAGKQQEAKDLTAKYGASKIPEIKEEDYVAILKEAEELL
ncbi:MAG TPA: hypothetical protein DCM59_01825 [Clostridium sp.]|nr:hypothetical protein [Clostridium sp.]